MTFSPKIKSFTNIPSSGAYFYEQKRTRKLDFIPLQKTCFVSV